MNSFYKMIRNLIAEDVNSSHFSFKIADPSAVGENPVRELSLDVVPVDETSSIVTLAWKDSAEKILEKTTSTEEANHLSQLISTDLAQIVKLTGEDKYDEAKDIMKNVLKTYSETTDTPVSTNLPKLHNTQAAQKCEVCEDLRSEKDPSREYDPTCVGYLCSKHETEYNKKSSQDDDKIWREAKITMQNLWFSTTDELLEYQEKQKKSQPQNDQDHIPLWDKTKQEKAPKDELAPASLSYEDMQNEKEKDHEDMQKHIDEKIKTELESALQEKAASVFGPDQVELVKVLRKNGRNWDEIKKILIKDFNFDKDSVNIFVDEQRQGTDPTSIEVEPIKEEPESLRPPKELIPDSVHEKLLQDHEDKKKVDSPVKEELTFTPEDVMNIPEDDEIEDKSSLLNNEIARADNDEIHKVAKDKRTYHTCPKCDSGWECSETDCEDSKDLECSDCRKKTSKKIATPSDLNPLQEPIQENPTTPSIPSQDRIPFGQSSDHRAPKPESWVIVKTDLKGELPAFRGKFISEKTESDGSKWGIVDRDGELLQVEINRITPESKDSGAQEAEPAMEPIIPQQQPDEEISVEPKMDDFHTSSLKTEAKKCSQCSKKMKSIYDKEEEKYVPWCSDHGFDKKSSQDELLAIKLEAKKLLADVDNMSKTAFCFPKDGIKKEAAQNDSAFEGDGWVRVWVDQDDVELDDRYPMILKNPDENARILALKEIARDIAYESLRSAVDDAAVWANFEFDSLAPSRFDRIDWGGLANPVDEDEEDRKFEEEMVRKYGPDAAIPPKPAESAQESVVEKKSAEESVMDTKCEDCGKPLGPEVFLSKWPVCGACTRKKHKKVTRGSDFEKGISQNKTAEADCVKCGAKVPYELSDKQVGGPFCAKCLGVDKEAADPEVAPKTQFKELKKTPNYVPKEQAVPASSELGEVLSKLDSIVSNLDTLKMARQQIEAKMNEEISKIDEQGQRAQMEAAKQESIEKVAVLIGALENKVVQWKDKLYTLQTEEITYVPKLTPTEMLHKIYAKFDGAEKYVKDVLNGMLSLGKNVVEKTVVKWPNKKFSTNKKASIIDDMNHYNDELLEALKELSSPL